MDLNYPSVCYTFLSPSHLRLSRNVFPLLGFLVVMLLTPGLCIAQQSVTAAPTADSRDVASRPVGQNPEQPVATAAQDPAATANQKADVLKQRLIAAVEQALKSRPYGDPDLIDPASAGVLLLDVTVDEKHQEIVLNFTQQILNYDMGSELESVLQHILSKAGDVELDWSNVNYKVLVDGTPIREIVAPFVDRIISDAKAAGDKSPVQAQQSRGTAKASSLSGKRIVISPGHGWVWGESSRAWRLQRGTFQGIVEDFVNAEMVMYLNEELKSTGAKITPTRNLSKSAGNGETGHPKWEEGAKYHISSQGAPSSVVNTGASDEAKDITSRPLYANYVGADMIVSLHNNGGKGTGTETWYDNSNGQQTESKKLATIVHNKVIKAIREQFDPNWKDRSLKSCSECKGENRFATRPAILLEIAFMDTPTPDNAALRNEKFKKLVAVAIRQGIEEYYAGTAPAGSFSLSSVTPFTATITQGSKVSFSVGVKSNGGFKSKVEMAAKNLPGNRVIAGTGWQPASVTPIANGTSFSTFILATDTRTPVGTFNVSLEGTSGGVTKKTTVQLTIKAAPKPDPTFTVTTAGAFTQTIVQGSKTAFVVAIKSVDGFKRAVQMSARNLPGNRVITGTGWQPAAVTPAANGTAHSTFILATDSRTPVGTFNVSLEGTSGGVTKKTTVQVIVKPVPKPVPSFTIATASGGNQTVKQGAVVSFKVAVKSIDGFKSRIFFAAKNLPGNRVITGTRWEPASITPAANGTSFAWFRLATDTRTPVGTFNIDLEGSSGGVTKKTRVQLKVKKK